MASTTTVSESQHVNHRREDSERKLERQRKKKLRANYQANPGVFEQEPEELHSEVDREEDTIVVITFCPTDNH